MPKRTQSFRRLSLMKPALDDLLKAYDAFKQIPKGPEASRLYTIYEAK